MGRAGTSFNLDMADLRPVFKALGADKEEVAALVKWVRGIEVEGGESFEVVATFNGKPTKLSIACFMDDVASPDLEFRGGKRLIEDIERRVLGVLERKEARGRRQKSKRRGSE